MVRITNAVYHEAYEYIKQDSVEGNCIVFVATDVDSLCAVLMFQALLKSDIIPHKIVPVSGYQDLKDANEKLIAKDDNLRSIVLFNCGGGELITNLFTTSPNTKIYVIDSHRPLLLDNLTSENNYVCVFDDDSESAKMKPIIHAYESLAAAEQEVYSEHEESDVEEDEDGRPMGRRVRQRRRLNEGLSNSERNERRRWNRMIAEYYNAGTFLCTSVAATVYQLAQQLGKTNNELLWLSIVGSTSLYIFERMDTYKYGELLEVFRDERARFNIDRDEDGTANPRHVVIQADDEYRFMLFRHWSLYNSMYHSGYVASKLGVWKDAGKKRLNNMFAKMGFSLTQCHQIYTHMNLELKNMLRDKIEVVAPLYGLTDICFPSFTRSYGWECCLSASDVVYSISTILETSPTAAAKLGTTLHWNETVEWQTEQDHAAAANNVELGGERSKWWMRNFYTAYDALNSSSPDGILRGIQLCMKTQEAIVRQGTAIIDKKLMKIFNSFRYIRLDTGPELSVFYHPSSLTKLALFLTDAYREHAKKNMPIVVGSYDEHDDSYLVVALSGGPTFGETRKNTLGLAFEEAADITKVRVSFDNFDPTIIQVHQKDIEHYMEIVRNRVH